MNTKPARGMRDFLPSDVRRRQYVIGVIADVYQRYGFEPLETPAVENIETLMGKYGEEGDRLIFKILKRGEDGKTGEADLALRYDLTVPLARVIAEHRATLPKLFKRYQVQPVWRADRPQKGRFREFYQCDVDAIGSTSMVVEAELLAAAADVLRHWGFRGFTIRLNHRQLLVGMLESVGVPHRPTWRRARCARQVGQDWPRRRRTRTRDPGAFKKPRPRHCSSCSAPLPRPRATADKDPQRFNLEVLSRLDGLVSGHRRRGERCRLVARTGWAAQRVIALAADFVRLDPSLARGLSYYTGRSSKSPSPTWPAVWAAVAATTS